MTTDKMSQTAIYQYLKQNPRRWFTVEQLSKAIGLLRKTANRNLVGLRRFNLIIYKKDVNRGRFGKYFYMHKRRTGD